MARVYPSKIFPGMQSNAERKVYYALKDNQIVRIAGARRRTSFDIDVRFQKRPHNPLPLKAGFKKRQTKVPWLELRDLNPILDCSVLCPATKHKC